MSSTSTSFIIIVLLFWTCHSWASVGGSSGYRRILHEPFFPLSSLPPADAPTSSSLHSQPQNQQPKHPSSNSNTPSTTATDAAGGNSNRPFFPSVSQPSWSPPPPHSVVATFPANISSLAVPESPSSRKTPSTRFVAVAAAVISVVALAVVALVLYYRPQRKTSGAGAGKGPWSDSLRLHHTVASTSDGLAAASAAANSPKLPMDLLSGGDGGGSKLGSPEIRPLPPLLPLPQHNLRITPSDSPTTNDDEEEEHEEEEFFSPRGSLGGGGRDGSSPSVSFHAIETLNFGSISPNGSSNFVSPDRSPCGNPSLLINSSPGSLDSESSDSAIIFPAPSLPPPLFLSPSPPCSPPAKSNPPTPPPPPPPPPLPRFWEERVAPAVVREPNSGPPAFVAPSRPIVVPPARQLQRSGSVDRTEDTTPKPKLKPLHWDKVRASSDRAMVWDQLNSSSFQLNEEMIETLFVVNGSNLNQKDCHWRPAFMSMVNQENRVLDPKKSQNIAILLRALNVTIDEVCEALLEGNADALGSELLDSLLKMAPTKVEEHKLKEYNDQSPFKLGPAENFLKAVIDIPFAFKRVDSMLYIANFDSEVEYLGRAFETLEAACKELRSSKMFLKLLEAVLKTGNRMNVGTIRGDAQAFKLDTLLKLVDIKGADGKTTLLHFVVQEIIRSEGSRLSGAKHNQNQTDDKPRQYDLKDDVEFRKLGLQVVSSLSGELSSIKKAATMDSDVLSRDVAALAGGITKVREVLELNGLALMEGSQRFSESMSGFLKKAEEEILRIQAQETTALSLVKEITEYFHGSSAQEEAHPFRIFMVVRDFLSILDHVCKEVRRINERTIVSSGRQLPQFGYPTTQPVFPGFSGRHHGGSSDEDSSAASPS